MLFNPLAIIALFGLGLAVVIGILVYLVIRSVKLKEEETFDKRDN